MNTVRLSNIALRDFRQFLFDQGCSRTSSGTKGRGGHEKWERKGLTRPITLQTHVDPVPEHIVKNCLRDLGVSRKEFENWLLEKK
jgi:hypothetical protein